MWAKIITSKRTKDLNYFSPCALNLFNTRVSQFELNYWNKWTFPWHSNLSCTCMFFLGVVRVTRQKKTIPVNKHYFVFRQVQHCNISLSASSDDTSTWTQCVPLVGFQTTHTYTLQTFTAVIITEVKCIASLEHIPSSLLGSSVVQSALYGWTVASRQIIECILKLFS